MELGGLDAAGVEAVLESHGALAVTYSDAADSPVLEPAPGETRLWPATRVSALFDADFDPAVLEKALVARLGLAGPPRYRMERIEDRAWEREWLRDFHAMRFGERLWICPGGEPCPADDAVVLRLDPGLAFGTGTHATTALCLEWLDAEPPRGASVLDYGCGSGILAIAALLLGAGHATAIDIDPQALRATRDNAERNGVGDRIEIAAPDDIGAKRYECVLANILSSTLIEHAPLLAARTRPGGRIALSGILGDQAEGVLAVYAPWYRLDPPRARDDWVLISGTRRED